MRTRYRSSPGSYTNQIDCSEPGWISGYKRSYASSYSWSFFGGSPGPYLQDESTIIDVLSPENLRYRPYNSCDHYRYSAAWLTGKKVVTFPAGTSPLAISVDHPFMYRPEVVVADGPWSSMVDELASLVAGNTKASAMLPVTLLEGPKTIAMLRNPFNLLKPSFQRRVKKLTALTLAKRGADVWLEGYYGWKSFYQDVTQLAVATAKFLNESTVSTLEDLGERLSVQKKTAIISNGASYALGTSESAWESASQDNWHSGEYPAMSNNLFRLANTHEQTKYTLGCRHFMETTKRIAYARRFLGAYGLSSWRSIRDTLWEVLPFSFVVDWFVDFRGIWAPLNMWRLGQADIKDVGHSISTSGDYVVESYINPWCCVTDARTPWLYKLPVSQDSTVFRSTIGKYKIYSRRPGFPLLIDGPSLFSGKGLTFVRGINGAALLTQIVAKPRKVTRSKFIYYKYKL